jgi:hypothetical protein
VVGSKVLDDHKGDPGVGRHVFEECFERLKAARRSPERGDQEFWHVVLIHNSRLKDFCRLWPESLARSSAVRVREMLGVAFL